MTAASSADFFRDLDEAPISRFHLKAVLVSGMGFFTDAYDLFVIGVVSTLIKQQWSLSTGRLALLNATMLGAAFLGALIFGRMADLLGRKRVYWLVAAIMIVAAVGSALAPSYWVLIAFRFLLGIGVGGDYPVSAVLMTEYSNRKDRGRLVGLVFSTQALGLIVGPLIALALLGAGTGTDVAWRILLALGAVPAAAVVYLRRTMPESPRYRAPARRNGARRGTEAAALATAADGRTGDVRATDVRAPDGQAADREGGRDQAGTQPAAGSLAAAANLSSSADRPASGDPAADGDLVASGGLTPGSELGRERAATVPVSASLRTFLTNRRLLAVLSATAGCWFLLDYAYYGNTISTPQIISLISPGSSTMTTIAIQLAIFVVAAVPGYILAIARIDRLGHRRLQIVGFGVMAACFAVIGLVPGMTTVVAPFLIVYGISYFFTEFGPNVTTFILPGEVFPDAVRATGHGISAGIGKFGAFIGVFLFPVLQTSLGLRGTLLLTAGVAVLGLLLTLVLPEPARVSLDDLASDYAPDAAAAQMLAVAAPVRVRNG